MFHFVFVTLSSNSIWSYSKVTDNDSNQSKGKYFKMTAVELFLGGSNCVALPPLKMFFVKNTRLHSHLILKFCLNFGNKNTDILLQLSGTCLTTCIIYKVNFTTHNYRMRALQIQSWYKYFGVFPSAGARFKILQVEIISLKNASGKNLKNILLKSRFYRDLKNLVWL